MFPHNFKIDTYLYEPIGMMMHENDKGMNNGSK